jgi:hypothetical protein
MGGIKLSPCMPGLPVISLAGLGQGLPARVFQWQAGRRPGDISKNFTGSFSGQICGVYPAEGLGVSAELT